MLQLFFVQAKIEEMFNCDCGHYKCAKPVSRSTWFRHKLASVLKSASILDDVQDTDPLPVEEVSERDEGEECNSPQQEPEVRFPIQLLFKIILG